MCNQQGAGEHGAPSHYLYQENKSVPGTRPGCLLVGGVGRWGGGMRPSLVDWIVTRAGQIPEAKCSLQITYRLWFLFRRPLAGERDPSGAIQKSPSPVLASPESAARGEAFSPPATPPRGLYPRPAAHPGDSPRARPPSPGSAAPACPRGALSPAGGPRAAPGGGSAAGLGERAAPETAPARAAQVLGAAPGCFLPGPGGGDPRPAGAARAQRRGWQGRPSRFRSIAARLSQPATAWPRLPPRPPGAPSPSGDQGRVRLGVWGRSCHPPVGTLAGLLLPGARGWAC